MTNFNPKIYLKDSDKARLADVRVRIVRDVNALSPDEYEDLVFDNVEREDDVPANALMKWNVFDGHNTIWFFTTEERCRKLVSNDPSYWTQQKLQEFANIEKKLWEDWRNGNVYGYIVEEWNAKERKWNEKASLYGLYGAESVLDNILDKCAIICIDSEDMKYDFDNTEKKVNEFD